MLARFILISSLLWALAPVQAAPAVHHRLAVSLDPQAGTLAVHDTLSLPEDAAVFDLHAGLAPRIESAGGRLETLPAPYGDAPIARYRLTLPAGQREVTLRYAGAIRHGVSQHSEEVGRARASSAGTIGPEGVFLDGASAWYPQFPGQLQTIDMSVELPEGWLAVSQGAGPDAKTTDGRTTVHWRESQPQDDLYLVAGRYHLYRRPGALAEAQVWLLQPDENLAATYLDATEENLARYSDLIGPYPYAKFALVENFWESGYGMPSFTLLGPQVIRLPFIVHTSYPHEILHNWWGNSVYVDYAHGNWSEGLTTYLADQLLASLRGQGADYRRTALQRYTDFAAGGRDFPLAEFHARHGGASQAVGYDKGMMLFHMLRLELGDETFISGLRRFYTDNRFRTAGFPELQAAFEAVSGVHLDGFIHQWVARSGAPELHLGEATVTREDETWRLHFTVEQVQSGPPYHLTVPYAVHLAGDAVRLDQLTLDGRQGQVNMTLADAPVRLDLDPRFDTFRRLDPSEIPSSLGQLFGAEKLLLVTPDDAPAPLRNAYRDLAIAWAAGQPQVGIIRDGELDALPEKGAVWLLGWENRFRGALEKALPTAARIGAQGVTLLGADYPADGTGVVLTTSRKGRPLALLASRDPAALPNLARKVPHYGKYSYLLFDGPDARNSLKGQWPVTASALQRRLGPGPEPSLLPPRPPLTE